MEHRIVFAVFAKKRDVFAEIHILQMISDKTAVTPLNAAAEFVDHGFIIFLHNAIVSDV